MYSNIKFLLLEKKAKETLSLDKAFCSVEEKIGKIFRPLSQIWDFLEGQKNTAHEQIFQKTLEKCLQQQRTVSTS